MLEIQEQRVPSGRDSECKALRKESSWLRCLEQSQLGRKQCGRNLRGGQGPNCIAQGKNTAITYPVCERVRVQIFSRKRECSLKVGKDQTT